MNLDGRKRAEFIQELHSKVKERLQKTADVYAKHANKGRKQVIFQPGDWVWLHLRKERFPEQRKSKLTPRGDGPFRVIRRINDNAYQLELPGEYQVHGTFNVADLSLFDTVNEPLDGNSPSKEGGDDGAVDSRSQVPHLPPGPITRSMAKKFKEKVSALTRQLEDENLLKPHAWRSLSTILTIIYVDPTGKNEQHMDPKSNAWTPRADYSTQSGPPSGS